jgi:hypothetical protein
MHGKIARKEAEAMIAAHALPVVEMDDLIAIVAGKQPHGSPLNARRWGAAGIADGKR